LSAANGRRLPPEATSFCRDAKRKGRAFNASSARGPADSMQALRLRERPSERHVTGMRFIRALAFTTLLFGTTKGFADDVCEATALRDVPAIEAPSSIIKKGQLDTAITQFRVDKRNGDTSFCSHGGYCYPTHIKVGGDKLQALRMKNCTVDAQGQEERADDYVIYGVTPLNKATQPERPVLSPGVAVAPRIATDAISPQSPRLPPAPLQAEYGSQDIAMLLTHQDGDDFVTKFMGHSFSSNGRFVSFEKANLPTPNTMYMGGVMTAGGQAVSVKGVAARVS